MSPEPIQPNPAKQHTWQSPNLPIHIAFDDLNSQQSSEHEDEHAPTVGYLPLAQEPTDSDSAVDDDDDDFDDDDDENFSNDDDCEKEREDMDLARQSTSLTSETTNTEPSLIPAPQPLQPNNHPSTSNHIHLDADKICQVTSIMANFKLPTETHPPWASTISEDQWKKQLIDRIQQDKHLELSSVYQ